MRRIELRIAALLALWLSAFAVQAHGLDVIAQHSDGQVSGLALYTDGTPAQAIYVALVAAEDATQVLDESKTGGSNATLWLLREDIARLQQHMWWRDLIGAIGYLVGIVGLWALWRSRQSGRVR